MKFFNSFQWVFNRVMKMFLLPAYFTVLCLFILKYSEMQETHPFLWYCNMLIWSTCFFNELEDRFNS